MTYKLVDLFAGPGGLSEGFSRVRDRFGRGLFEKILSVEANEAAHKTLTLREFYRVLNAEGMESPYWRYLTNDSPEARAAVLEHSAWQLALRRNGGRALTLGIESDDEFIEQQLSRAGLSDDDAWVLIGGPPCQAYSLMGRARMQGKDPLAFARDHRHVLYREYLRIISLFRPAVFVMENVKGLLSSKLEGERIFEQILEDLRGGGADRAGAPLYEVRSLVVPTDHAAPSDFVVRSEYFGIPQSRHRVFLVGVHRDVVSSLRHAGATSWSQYLLSPTTPTESEFLTAEQAIGDLPPLTAISSKSRQGSREDAAIRRAFAAAIRAARNDELRRTMQPNRDAAKVMSSALRRRHRARRGKPGSARASVPLSKLRQMYGTSRVLGQLGHVPNHDARRHMPEDLARYLYASAWAAAHGRSPTLSNYPRSLLPRHSNVRAGVTQAVFADRFRVQVADRPSTTVTSHISKDGHYFIHYDPAQHRSLSVREAARLQTFPDDYFFEGARTAQYHQVGNAVPPLLAEQIGRVVVNILKAAGC